MRSRRPRAVPDGMRHAGHRNAHWRQRRRSMPVRPASGTRHRPWRLIVPEPLVRAGVGSRRARRPRQCRHWPPGPNHGSAVRPDRRWPDCAGLLAVVWPRRSTASRAPRSSAPHRARNRLAGWPVAIVGRPTRIVWPVVVRRTCSEPSDVWAAVGATPVCWQIGSYRTRVPQPQEMSYGIQIGECRRSSGAGP
ncbi:unannotated protein [freshwater metagenome]|uniref:Unannotated protein n=1 Tax=freshwater metagenome TaxID=449393 RepID=A0A6J7KS44_9ZZZZ